MKYVMGIDNGGTFCKAAIFDEKGNQISIAKVKANSKSPSPSFIERDMQELFNINILAVKTCIEESSIDASDIIGVSFSGHGKGLYVLGTNGNIIYNGIASTDTRAAKLVKKWKEAGVFEQIFPKTYQEVLACQPVSLLAWLKDTERHIYDNIQYVFHIKDYVRYRFTGEAYAEYTDSSGGNLVNLNTKQYDKELLEIFGIPEIYEALPPLKYSFEACGSITKEISTLTGLAEGTKVAAGMFDIDACALATGVINEDEMCMIAGTWSINEYIAKAPITNNTVSLNSMYCMEGYFLVEESSPTSAGNLEWFVQNLLSYEKSELESSRRSIYALADEWATNIEPMDSNVLFLPFLNGSNEDAEAKATFIGLTEFHTKKHMLRAVYEGIVFSHLTHVKRLLQNREVPKSIRLSGGAANSKVWTQIFADALQIPIDIVGDKELGCQGAAMVAGIASGMYSDFQQASQKTFTVSSTVYPRKEYKEIYEKKYALYRSVVDSLSGCWESF